MQSQRRSVVVNLGTIEDGDSTETVFRLIQQANARSIKEGIVGLHFDISCERGYYDDVCISVDLVGSRPETDEEYELRTQSEHRQRESSEKEQRALYERLRKKFGGKEQ